MAKPSYIGSLLLLHRTYRHLPFGARLHVLIRFLTCPFLRFMTLVPAGTTLLDIGAGHSLFPSLALEVGAKKVFSVEPDLRKTLLPLRQPRIKPIAAFDDAVRGTFETISIIDATYRIPLEIRDQMYRRVFERLAPGGLFILKDMDADNKLKMRWARLQELVSDRLLGVSLGEGFIYEGKKELRERLEAIGFTDFAVHLIGGGYPHPHAVFTARKPVSQASAISHQPSA